MESMKQQKYFLSIALFIGILTSSCSSESTSTIDVNEQLQSGSVDEVTNGIDNNTAYDTSALINHYTCSEETKIHAEKSVDFEGLCQSLLEVESLFFDRFGSEPVSGDYNNNRDLYIYKDRDSYLATGFNASSYGKYIEQDPSDPDSHGEIYSYLLDSGNVKNQSHEYIHYLDGRFNKDGDYHATDMAAWWTEGIAEYMQHLHWQSPSTFIKQSISQYGSDFSLETIFSLTKDDYKTDYFNLLYDGGNVALCFFIQEEPRALTTLLSYSRSGNWSAWVTELDRLASVYGDKFDVFVKDVVTDKKVCHLNALKAD
jgi:microbial collagenase